MGQKKKIEKLPDDLPESHVSATSEAAQAVHNRR